MNSLLTSLPLLMPAAFAWAEQQEALFIAQGKPLSESRLADARRAGVVHPEKIRVALVEALPEPENEDMLFVAKHLGLFSSRSVGLTLGYGVCLKRGWGEDRYTLVHECVHVGQYERLEGIRPFLGAYLRECVDPGYPFGRLEQEAILVARDICKTDKRGAQ